MPTYGIVALAIDQENNNLYFSDVSFDRTGIYRVSLEQGTSQGRRMDRIISQVFKWSISGFIPKTTKISEF